MSSFAAGSTSPMYPGNGDDVRGKAGRSSAEDTAEVMKVQALENDTVGEEQEVMAQWIPREIRDT